MSVKTKSFGLGITFFILSLTGILLFGAQGFLRKDDAREIHLVAKGMSFRVEESDIQNSKSITPVSPNSTSKSNPILSFKPGEKVKITLRNEDRGILHDFKIEGLKVKLSRPLLYEESESFTITVPEEGKYEYYCSNHPEMMRGEISIEH